MIRPPMQFTDLAGYQTIALVHLNKKRSGDPRRQGATRRNISACCTAKYYKMFYIEKYIVNLCTVTQLLTVVHLSKHVTITL